MPERMAEYLKTAGEQIRWRRARPALTRELQTHLLEQMDDCLAQGMDETAAEAETLRQMGDPVEVGRELDSVHRPAPQWGLLILIGILALAGGFLRVWLSADAGDPYLRISPVKTVFYVTVGFAAMLGGYFLDYTMLGRHPGKIYAGVLLATLATWVWSPRLAGIPYFTRYAVLLYPLVYALLVYALRGKGFKAILLAILGGVPLAFFAYFTPYVLGLLILLLVGAVVLVMAVWKNWFSPRGRRDAAILGGSMILCTAGILWWLRYHYYSRRLYFSFYPEQDPLGSGYMALTIRSALEGAQWWGRGVMTGRWAGHDYWSVVPEGVDCLLTTMVHILGWGPFLLLCGALCILMIWALVKALRQKNMLGRLVAVAVIMTLVLQMICGVMLNMGFVLISAHCPLLVGNLHTAQDMAMLGVMLSVFRQERLPAAAPRAAQLPAKRWKLVIKIVEA